MTYKQSRGFYKHGNLPHLDLPGAVQFLSIVMADAAPKKQQIRRISSEFQSGIEIIHAIDCEVDGNSGSCLLKHEHYASCVVDSIFRTSTDGQHNPLAWVIMPNHLHLLTRVNQESDIGRIVNRLKSGSATSINRLRGSSGKFWQRGYFDRMIRSDDQLWRTIDYIHNNPVEAGLVSDPQHWKMSSIHGFSREAVLEKLR
ncbi:transposase [bacterium]|nr:transposase [bacterium]